MGRMTQNPRYNVISMRINDDEEKFFRGLIESGKFPDKTAALRHFVESGMKEMEGENE